jgi:outer membrane receptor protein involved in Fe transport
MRIRGTRQLAVNEIEQLQVITGGIEAKYGDVAGGLVSITTRGPSSKFAGGAEVETSRFLDPFGYTFGLLNLSGPIWKKTGSDGVTKESVLGYRFSGQIIDVKDDNPTPVKRAYLTDEARTKLENNPVTIVGSSKVPSAEFLTNKDVNFLNYRPNEGRRTYDFTGKLDAKLAKNVDVTLLGTMYSITDKFTPADNSGRTFQVYNSQNNPLDINNRYRGNFRLRHRLTNSNSDKSETENSGTKIKNASYILQVGYEVGTRNRYDSRHKDNLFDYGYVGEFKNRYDPTFRVLIGPGGNPTGIVHNDYQEVFTGYKAGTVNPVLANYNNVSDVNDLNDFNTRNGQYIGTVKNVWELHQNIGNVYNNYEKRNDNTFTGQVSFNFDLIPGGKLDKAHNIQFGLLYEQRVDRFYSVNPFALWVTAAQQSNRQINGIDTNSIKGRIPVPADFSGLGQDSVDIYNLLINQNTGDQTFWKKVRQRYGLSEKEYINVNALDPSKMSLDLFSAQELNDQNLLTYYGYDYLGNKLPATTNFREFFTTKKDGIRTFPVAAYQPLYTAAYVQDKFTFKDVIFNVGLRVDRFDANTSVLKDLYSLYDIEDAKSFYTRNNKVKPSNIDDTYKIYVTGENSESVQAYRKDNQWYNSKGEPVAPEALFGTKQVFPKYVKLPGNKDITPNYIKEIGYNPDYSFEDYKPQINWMPRLSFSFPISDFANFFAHYDVLAQRPSGNNIATASDYYYINNLGDNTINNPNLKPEKTVDYEVGFQQRLNNTSAIKIAAYYKEIRDNINIRRINYVPTPIFRYATYDNLDFSTVKGFTFQYDLRRTGNFQGQLNYTLQFADGTGSDARSQLEISRLQNIRTLYPQSFDERHRFAVNLDYRYGDGAKYDGPKLFNKNIFANSGINFLINTVSGRPYTAKSFPQQFDGSQTLGGINGSRKPWTFTIDARLDKSFTVAKTSAHPLNINVYLRVQNLLNTLNVEDVYPATGSATDDGYLQSSNGISQLNQISNANRAVQSYIDSYQWRLLNPGNFALPRRIFIGATLDF